MWLYGRLYSVLADVIIMWRWENVLLNEFLNWSLKMLLVMCCYQTYMVLLITGISVGMLNGRAKKEKKKKRCFICVTIARNWLLHWGSSIQLLVLLNKKKSADL